MAMARVTTVDDSGNVEIKKRKGGGGGRDGERGKPKIKEEKEIALQLPFDLISANLNPCRLAEGVTLGSRDMDTIFILGVLLFSLSSCASWTFFFCLSEDGREMNRKLPSRSNMTDLKNEEPLQKNKKTDIVEDVHGKEN